MYSAGLTCPVGGRPGGGKDPTCPSWRGIATHNSLVETGDITMMWDTTIPTAKKIKANRQDICLRNKKTNTCLLIDISCPADGNRLRSW